MYINYSIAENVPRITLNNGLKIPIVGFGTGSTTEQAVHDAINSGYRHIDTSLNYGNSEKIIGKVLKEVLKEGKVKRQDMFIVSKLEGNYHERKRVPIGIKESLARLGLDYLDMYLIHSPESTPKVDILETWQGMTDVLKDNLTKSIGVSNFNEQQLDKIMSIKTNVKPVTNQVICNPYRNQKKLLSYLKKHDITLTAYSPVGGNRDVTTLLKDSKLVAIGQRHNVTSAQVALKYQVQRGVIVIPKAKNIKHMKENIDLFSFKLTDNDIKEIEALNKLND